MPVWIAELLGALIRWLLMLLLVPLVSRSLITQDIADTILANGVPQILAWVAVLIPLALSWWQKYKARKLKLLALAMPPGTDEKELTAKSKQISGSSSIGPTVTTFIVVVIIAALAGTGCTAMLEDRAAGLAGLSELERGKLQYVEAANEWMLVGEEIYSDRQSGALTDAEWAEFDALQNGVRAVSLRLIAMRRQWEETGVKPAGWDAAMAELLIKVAAGSKLAGGK